MKGFGGNSKHKGVSVFLFTGKADVTGKRYKSITDMFGASLFLVSNMGTQSSTNIIMDPRDMESYGPESALGKAIKSEHKKKRFVVVCIDYLGDGFSTELYGRKWLSTDGKLQRMLNLGCDCVLLPKTSSSKIEERVDLYNKNRSDKAGLRIYDMPAGCNIVWTADTLSGFSENTVLEGGQRPFYSVVKNDDRCAEIMKGFGYHVLSMYKSMAPNETATEDLITSDPLSSSSVSTDDGMTSISASSTPRSSTSTESSAPVLFTPSDDLIPSGSTSRSPSIRSARSTSHSSSEPGLFTPDMDESPSSSVTNSDSELNTSDLIQDMSMEDL